MYVKSAVEKLSALQLRQSLGKAIERLERTGEPILLEKGRRPVAVLISLQDFRERFAEKEAMEARDRVLEELRGLRRPSVDRTPAVEILRELRGAG